MGHSGEVVRWLLLMVKLARLSFIYFWVIQVLSPFSYAERPWSSGGGAGVATYVEGMPRVQENLVQIEVLDLWRMRKRQGYQRNYTLHPDFEKLLGPSRLSTEEQSELFLIHALKRIAGKNAILARRLENARSALQKWTSEPPKNLIPDFGGIQLLPHEVPVQIIERKLNQIIFSPPYYERLSALNRAAIKLHELVYAVSNHRSSLFIQELVAFVFSREWDPLSPEDFSQLAGSLFQMKYQVLSDQIQDFTWPEGFSSTNNLLKGGTCGFLMDKVAEDSRSIRLTYHVEDQPGNTRDRASEFVFWSQNWHASKKWKIRSYDLDERTRSRLLEAQEQAEGILRAKFLEILYPLSHFDRAFACFNFLGALKYFEVRMSYPSRRNDEELASNARAIEKTLEERRFKILEEKTSQLYSAALLGERASDSAVQLAEFLRLRLQLSLERSRSLAIDTTRTPHLLSPREVFTSDETLLGFIRLKYR